MYTDQKNDVVMAVANSVADAAFAAATRNHPATPATVRRLWATVTTVISTAASVITFTYRPTPGSATGQVTLGTLTIPNTTAVGKFLYKNLTSAQKIMPGGELVASFSGGSAGAATLGVTTDPSWDSEGNNTNAIASA